MTHLYSYIYTYAHNFLRVPQNGYHINGFVTLRIRKHRRDRKSHQMMMVNRCLTSFCVLNVISRLRRMETFFTKNMVHTISPPFTKVSWFNSYISTPQLTRYTISHLKSILLKNNAIFRLQLPPISQLIHC